MKRRRVLIALALVFVATVFAVVLWPGEREPEYQGKKLSQWISYVPPTNMLAAWIRVVGRPGTPAEEMDAVRHMGTNAVRCLVRWVAYEPAKWRLKLRGSVAVARAPKAWRLRLNSLLTPAAEGRAVDAAVVLKELRPEKLPMDVLDRIAADPKRPYAAGRVKSLLIEIRTREAFRRNLIAEGARLRM